MNIEIKNDGKGKYQSVECDLAQHFQNSMSNASVFITSYGKDEEESKTNMISQIREIVQNLEQLLNKYF